MKVRNAPLPAPEEGEMGRSKRYQCDNHAGQAQADPDPSRPGPLRQIKPTDDGSFFVCGFVGSTGDGCQHKAQDGKPEGDVREVHRIYSKEQGGYHDHQGGQEQPADDDKNPSHDVVSVLHTRQDTDTSQPMIAESGAAPHA